MTSYTQDPIKILGSRLRKIREQQGISQIALSVRAGFNFNYAGMVERGDTNPSFLALMNLGLALGKDVSEITKGITSKQIMVLRESPNRRDQAGKIKLKSREPKVKNRRVGY